jgi:mRNA interferase HicA
MKRRDLLRHLRNHGCELLREGGEHSIWRNSSNNRRTSIPRHREILEYTAAKICKQLDVPAPAFLRGP